MAEYVLSCSVAWDTLPNGATNCSGVITNTDVSASGSGGLGLTGLDEADFYYLSEAMIYLLVLAFGIKLILRLILNNR